MKTLTISVFVALVWFLAAGSLAEDTPRLSNGPSIIHGGSANFGKAGQDTINLMAATGDPTNNADPRDGGFEPFYDGDFEDAGGNPSWNGWTHWDITQPTVTHFQVSDYQQSVPGNYAAWCGEIGYAACDTNDIDGGYGNNWHDLIEFRQAMPDPGQSTQVNITATLQYDTEPGYDFVYLSYKFEGQSFADLLALEGAGLEAVDQTVTYDPGDYVGGTDIAVYFRFKSDGTWSDEDCIYPGVGACQIDDIKVHVTNGAYVEDFFEDFQHGGDPADLGLWTTVFPDGVGDFAYVWTGLGDADPCVTNHTPQVAFIDDGLVVPGTGGSNCMTWCYGPGGYIVNTQGGLAGPSEHLHNAIESPVMAWPNPKVPGSTAEYDGINLEFTVYKHESLINADSPGIFFTWGVRSADIDDSAGNGAQSIYTQPWRDRNILFFGGPEYLRDGDDVTDLMNPGRDVVQVQLAVYELGFAFGFEGNNGTPAPYFDNVTVKVFPHLGPGMAAREIDLAQDNFPARGTIDMGDLGSHSVRFDMANNISVPSHLRNDPGDTIVVDVKAVRAGAELAGEPVLHYTVDRNPLFDPYRGPAPAVGTSVGMPAIQYGNFYEGKWAFDLPDTGFLFPGDVLHYYIAATDAIGGTGGSDPRTATMPADLTGYGVFDDPMAYDSSFVVHALPSFKTASATDHPPILFINDFGSRGGQNEWYTALNNIGLIEGEDYDTYYVNAPSSGIGNGIGGRANEFLLEGYTEILYTSGDLPRNTISNGDFNVDPGDDAGTLKAWLDSGGKDIFLTGSDFMADLARSGITTHSLLQDYLGLNSISENLSQLINNQASPVVQAEAGNPVFSLVDGWVAFAGCIGRREFEAAEVRPGTLRLAEFLSPAGQSGAYTYAAAALNPTAGFLGTSRVISLPYDLMDVYSDPTLPGQLLPARALLLEDVLYYFDQVGDPGAVTPALPEIAFATGNYPNPFNPSTTISYTVPRTGHLSLKIYDVRGQLVRTLIDGQVEATSSGAVVWDGTDSRGAAVSSGIYFYEARTGGEIRVEKMALVK